MVLAFGNTARHTALAPTLLFCSEDPLAPGVFSLSPGAFWKPPMAEIFAHIFTYICGVASGCILAAYLIRGA